MFVHSRGYAAAITGDVSAPVIRKPFDERVDVESRVC